MDKIEYRAVIKFLTLEGSDYKAIHERLLAVYGSAAPSLSTVSLSVFGLESSNVEDSH